MRSSALVSPKKRALGAAMVEFAIVALLSTLLIAGGIELAMAAFSSQRATDGARAGADAWIRSLSGAGVYDPVNGANFTIPSGQGLGDHALANFSRPACGVLNTVYSDGLPADSVSNGGQNIYLYNPRPIDTTLCLGQDGTDPDRSRMAVLVDRLPALNRSIYSLYQRRCANALGAETPCALEAAVSTYLRLPGRLDPLQDTVTLAFLENDPESPNFQMPLPDSPRPTFAIQCAPATSSAFGECDSAALPNDVCRRVLDGAPLACEVRVRTRMRFVFHAFLQYPFVYWRNPLPAAALAQLDTGPAGRQGTVGSETVRGNARRFQRTFLGCWETVTVAPTAGMLGNRTSRGCT